MNKKNGKPSQPLTVGTLVMASIGAVAGGTLVMTVLMAFDVPFLGASIVTVPVAVVVFIGALWLSAWAVRRAGKDENP